jgi:hypothetical protein
LPAPLCAGIALNLLVFFLQNNCVAELPLATAFLGGN